MSNTGATRSIPRVLFFGMQGSFSSIALAALLASNACEVCAVVIPAASRSNGALRHAQPLHLLQRREAQRATRTVLPLYQHVTPTSVTTLAWERQVPLWEVSDLADEKTLTKLAEYRPDVLCVACFSLRIPAPVLSLPRLGSLNVHPSLLPANRGPVPLFWTFREGHDTTGVTIHLMNERMDSGDILAQQPVAVPDGIRYEHLESACAIPGSSLLVQTVQELFAERAERRVQDEALSTYHSFPSSADFLVDAQTWSARHVYNFICGVGDWDDEPVTVLASEGTFSVRRAFSYSLYQSRPVARALRETYPVAKGVALSCRDGVVYAR